MKTRSFDLWCDKGKNKALGTSTGPVLAGFLGSHKENACFGANSVFIYRSKSLSGFRSQYNGKNM